MAERSFKAEVEHLRLGAGETFTGEGILAITKALLENGVGYVGGYQGAPISHLMDVLADAQDILTEHGIRFENSASEATAVGCCSHSGARRTEATGVATDEPPGVPGERDGSASATAGSPVGVLGSVCHAAMPGTRTDPMTASHSGAASWSSHPREISSGSTAVAMP